MKPAFVAFGELLLRLDAPGHERLIQAEGFSARYTGAEANVAVSLATFGWDACVVSRVPAHEIGQACINHLRRHGVNTDFVVRGGDRLGILFVETGASQRPTQVIYDRSGSSFREASPDDFDWPRILEGKRWLHLSGTAPALGAGVIRILEEGMRVARRLGLKVSLDCNYRSKLWSAEDAGRTLSALLPSVDVFVASPHDASNLFGIAAEPGSPPEESCGKQAAELSRRFGCRVVAMTLREGGSASESSLQGLLCWRGESCVSRRYDLSIVDRIGGGDAFTAGLIHGLEAGWAPRDVVEFAAAAACLKHSIPGDFNLATVEEVLALVQGGTGDRVSR